MTETWYQIEIFLNGEWKRNYQRWTEDTVFNAADRWHELLKVDADQVRVVLITHSETIVTRQGENNP